MIKSCRDKRTAALFALQAPKGFPSDVVRAAQRKLWRIHTVGELADLMVPPGNRLEALSGDRQGQYSIRINDQWRICFTWRDGDALQVEVTDYH